MITLPIAFIYKMHIDMVILENSQDVHWPLAFTTGEFLIGYCASFTPMFMLA